MMLWGVFTRPCSPLVTTKFRRQTYDYYDPNGNPRYAVQSSATRRRRPTNWPTRIRTTS